MSLAAAPPFRRDSWVLGDRSPELTVRLSGDGPALFRQQQQAQEQNHPAPQSRNRSADATPSFHFAPTRFQREGEDDMDPSTASLDYSFCRCQGHASSPLSFREQQTATGGIEHCASNSGSIVGATDGGRSCHVPAEADPMHRQQTQEGILLQKLSALSVHFGSSAVKRLPALSGLPSSTDTRHLSQGLDAGQDLSAPSSPEGLFQTFLDSSSRSSSSSISSSSAGGSHHRGTLGLTCASNGTPSLVLSGLTPLLDHGSSQAAAVCGPSRVFSCIDAADEQSPPFSPDSSAAVGSGPAPKPFVFCGSRASAFPAQYASCPGRTGVLSPRCLAGCAFPECPCRPHSAFGFASPLLASAIRPHGMEQGWAKHSEEMHHSLCRPMCVPEPRQSLEDGQQWMFPHATSSSPFASGTGIAAPQVGPACLAALDWTLPQGQPQGHLGQAGAELGSAASRELNPRELHHLAPCATTSLARGACDLGSTPPSQWGLGAQSMDSSSLSLSQECSGSGDAGEVRDPKQDRLEEQEVESVFFPGPSAEGHGSWPSSPGPGHSSLPFAPAESELRPPLAGRAALLPAVHSLPNAPDAALASQAQRNQDGSATRRSLSSYFGGKSRSFTSLAEVASIQSIQDLAKPVRSYQRRKRLSSAGTSPKGPDGSRCRLLLGVARDARQGLFKKGNSTRQSLGFQASLAVACAMGGLATGPSSPDKRCMETVMEESVEETQTGEAEMYKFC